MSKNCPNIFNKWEMISKEDRKKPISHGGSHFMFHTCADLSIGVKVVPFGNWKEFTINQYSNDLSEFIYWWNNFVKCDLKGFSGFGGKKFEMVGFTIHNPEVIPVHDIRNKLSPLTNLMALITDPNIGWGDVINQIPACKKSINYLAKRNVYEKI